MGFPPCVRTLTQKARPTRRFGWVRSGSETDEKVGQARLPIWGCEELK